MQLQLKNEIIQQLKNIDFKEIFKWYIDRGLEVNPELLLQELYEQIKGDPQDDYRMSKALLGNNTVMLILKYFEN